MKAEALQSSSARGTPEARSLRELSPRQWKSGIAAWLGWMFDGLDMHLYTLVAAPFVAQLLAVGDAGDPLVKEKSSWIQASFLVGWALGGAFFGRLGDRLGRSRALSLTILTYAAFTGLSFFVDTWWQLLICRFLAALGIGGEWAVGASLLSETWPKRWRPWIAAVLQMGVNIGILLACGAVALISACAGYLPGPFERYVFLVGVLPALMVFWIRRHVPEPEEWQSARAEVREQPRVRDLFRGGIRRTTLLTIAICSVTLTGWWAFIFWHQQYLRSLPELASWKPAEIQQLATLVFFLVVGVSIFGNFFCAWLATLIGYRRTILWMCLSFFVSFYGAFREPRGYESLLVWLPLIGFCSGVFGLFTMYMPPLFPTLLRTTGAGFCYNIGRVVAAAGTVIFGLQIVKVDFRLTLLTVGFLFLAGAFVSLFLPELSREESGKGD